MALTLTRHRIRRRLDGLVPRSAFGPKGWRWAIEAVGRRLAGRGSGSDEARLARELPALLEAVARSLRSGASMSTALRESATGDTLAAAELARVLLVADQGAALVDALDDWVRARPTPGVRLTVGALAVAVTAGGSPARGLDGVAATLRARNEVEREVRALATQARASAAVMAVAPVGFAFLGLLGDRGAASFLFGSAAGWACLVAGLVLDVLGAGWMARIARGPR